MYARQSNLEEHMLNCRRQRQQWLDKFCKLCFYYSRDHANLRRHEGSSNCWKRRQRFLAQTESCYDDVKKYLCGSWSIDNFADSFPNMVGTSSENEVAIAISSSKRKRRDTLFSLLRLEEWSILTFRHQHDMLAGVLKAQQRLSQGPLTSQQTPLSRRYLSQGLPLSPRLWFHRESVAPEKGSQNHRNAYPRNGSLQ